MYIFRQKPAVFAMVFSTLFSVFTLSVMLSYVLWEKGVFLYLLSLVVFSAHTLPDSSISSNMCSNNRFVLNGLLSIQCKAPLKLPLLANQRSQMFIGQSKHNPPYAIGQLTMVISVRGELTADSQWRSLPIAPVAAMKKRHFFFLSWKHCCTADNGRNGSVF